MTSEQTSVIAEILGLSAENISALPEDIKSEMDFIAENSSPKTSEERLEVYRAFEDCWRKAMTIQAIDEISAKLNIGREILDSLDTDAQKYIADIYLSGFYFNQIDSNIILCLYLYEHKFRFTQKNNHFHVRNNTFDIRRKS